MTYGNVVWLLNAQRSAQERQEAIERLKQLREEIARRASGGRPAEPEPPSERTEE